MRVLVGMCEKARGLLGTGADAEPVVLVGCRSIHTMGMRYPIDVAFVSPRGHVLKVEREVGPGRMVSCRRAYAVMERPASSNRWVSEGDVLAICVGRSPDEDEEATWTRV